jgi:exodeoxyribonuclease VII large subunit
MIQKKDSRIFTVSAVNKYIHGMFEQDYLLSSLKVEGEISNYKFDQRGHLYFSLKDETGALSCVMYRFNQQAGIKCRLENGLKCVVTGSVNVYERGGVYQLYAKQIEPKGLGDLFERFEALKQRLGAEGLFDTAHKKPIPPYCKKIGIVTASTGAVIHDILNVSSRRNPYVQLILCPSKVQGDGAAQEIAESIQILDSFGLDCIIVGRGGGSMEDLWAFNEEVVARAVYACETPIISAVGHETDTTLCDYAADLRAPTPSAAAELAVFDLNEALGVLNDAQQKLMRRMNEQLQNRRLQLSGLDSKLQALHPSHRVNRQQQMLINYRERLRYTMEKRISAEQQLVNRSKNQLAQNRTRLQNDFQTKLSNKRHAFALLSQRLDGLSPVKRLTGGYAYVTGEDGMPLMSIEQVEPHQLLTVRTADGKIAARVEEKKFLNKDQIG